MAGIAMPEIMSAADYRKFSDETGYKIKPRNKNTSFQEESGVQSYGRILDAKSYATHKRVSISEARTHMSVQLPGSRVADFLEKYEAFKKREGKYDFDDMLLACLGKGPIGTPIILVDECQDLSDLQLELIKQWSVGAEALYLAGDDDQSIYAFNGASEYGFLDFPADDTRILRKSYRVPLVIGERAERVIKKVKKRQPKNVEWTLNEGEIRRYRSLNSISSALKEAFETGRDVMIMVRHRNQTWETRKWLKKHGIICTLDGKMPWKISSVKQVKNFYHLLSGGKLNATDMAALLTAQGQKTEAAKIRKKLSIQKEFGLDDVEGLSWKNMDIDIVDAVKKHGIEILDKELTIDVSTYHSSKGRETDVAIVLTDCYTKVSDTLRRKPDTERRLCYVALTRAREKLIIINPEDPLNYMKPVMEA